ncbi:S-adenosylmethionine decarboxylase [Candidatus Bathyarchaeota archaeon]|nr:S-adenosylmethionine decarboxylase [Candidatus Bathyarchaeota archaeon]
MIGMHLIVDGVIRVRVSGREIHKVLSELPSEIGMKVLSGPYIVEGNPENPGWTGVVIIDKSHIAIHTFDLESLISIDIYSCKPFNGEAVLRYLKSSLPLGRFSYRIFVRDVEEGGKVE